jgi:hypothetical protein
MVAKLLAEQRTPTTGEAHPPRAVIVAPERYNLILQELHKARLGELQAAHDVAHFKAQRLKQQQQSGTQQHLVVSEKRRLGTLIGKAHRERKRLINDMTPFIRYIGENKEDHGIPVDWKKTAREGAPYWCNEGGESDMGMPSIAEKRCIVESYLK